MNIYIRIMTIMMTMIIIITTITATTTITAIPRANTTIVITLMLLIE